MKKLFLTLIIVFINTLNVSADSVCDSKKIETLRKELDKTSFEYSVMPKGSTYYHPILLETLDASNDIKIEMQNLPNNFYVLIKSGEFLDHLVNNTTVLSAGGVYTLMFYSMDCDEPVKQFQIKVPSYDPTNKKDVWFDGTYTPTSSSLKPKKEKASIGLIIILIILVVIIVAFITMNIIKRRKNVFDENKFK